MIMSGVMYQWTHAKSYWISDDNVVVKRSTKGGRTRILHKEYYQNNLNSNERKGESGKFVRKMGIGNFLSIIEAMDKMDNKCSFCGQ